jgi:hypothetical protein
MGNLNLTQLAVGAILGLILSAVSSTWINPRFGQFIGQRSDAQSAKRQKVLTDELEMISCHKMIPAALPSTFLA